MEITGAEAIVRCLEMEGVEHVFGLCGHANLSLLDALEASSIRFISTRHEQCAVHAADAYWRFSHKPGVVITTIGPGLANAVTGVLEACLDSSAVLVIAGDVPSYFLGREAFQEVAVHADGAQAEMFRPIAKRTWRVPDVASVPYAIQRALNYCQSGRPGPVVVDVPIDYMAAVREWEFESPRRHRATGGRIRGDRQEIEKAAALLLAARSPLLYAGGGAVLSEAAAELVGLAEYLGAPVATSMIAQGIIPKTHPLNADYPGTVGTPTGVWAAKNADVVLAVGTRFGELETSSWDPRYGFDFKRQKLIQVDIDPHEIGKAYPVTVGIVGDARAVLAELLSIVQAESQRRPWQEREYVRELQRVRAEWQVRKAKAAGSDEVPLRVERVFREVRQVLPPEGLVLTDVGTFRHGVGHFIDLYEPQTFYIPSGLGTMGAAMAAPIGAKLARPERPVVALVGDAGFTTMFSALITAVEYGIPAVYVVLNNYGYDSIRTYQHKHYDGRELGTSFAKAGRPYNPDFARLAEACGAGGRRVEKASDLTPALREALASNVPYVLDVWVAPTRLEVSGNWDVNDVLAREAAFKRRRIGKSAAADD